MEYSVGFRPSTDPKRLRTDAGSTRMVGLGIGSAGLVGSYGWWREPLDHTTRFAMQP